MWNLRCIIIFIFFHHTFIQFYSTFLKTLIFIPWLLTPTNTIPSLISTCFPDQDQLDTYFQVVKRCYLWYSICLHSFSIISIFSLQFFIYFIDPPSIVYNCFEGKYILFNTISLRSIRVSHTKLFIINTYWISELLNVNWSESFKKVNFFLFYPLVVLLIHFCFAFYFLQPNTAALLYFSYDNTDLPALTNKYIQSGNMLTWKHLSGYVMRHVYMTSPIQW
jgi:hypothetical protein